mmetsp:Transcript_112371/g.317595  ORF Transcript_112371/g.317595 Transcript_112371/m.317595 type:complete len:182 (+) Transcript_112371:99-644(+)
MATRRLVSSKRRASRHSARVSPAIVLVLAALSAVLSGCFVFAVRPAAPPMADRPSINKAATQAPQAFQRAWGVTAQRPLDAHLRGDAIRRRIFGLGTSEILVILAVGAVFFGPEALKGVAKEAGKAAGDLKDVPKAFQEGMDETEGQEGAKKGEDTKEGSKTIDAETVKDETSKDAPKDKA